MRWHKKKPKRSQVIGRLVKELASRDARVRDAAADEVEARNLVNDADIAPYYTVARRDWTRAAAIGPPALKPLVAALRDPRHDNRWAVAITLGDIGMPEAIPPLVAALKHKDPELSVRWAAARALGTIGHKKAVPDLLMVLEDQDPNVRKAAVDALGMIGDSRALSPLLRRMEDGDARVREAAIGALACLGPAVIDLLTFAYETALNREPLVKALGAIADPRAADVLLEALADRNPAVRREAAWALGEVGAAKAADDLYLRAVVDSERDVRRAATFALAKLGDSRAVAPLVPVIDEGSFEERIQAITTLGELGSSDATTALIYVLEDVSISNLPGREAAAAALGKIGDPRAIEALQQALDDPVNTVREAAQTALERLKTDETQA
jgi:HEAT repeat protein